MGLDAVLANSQQKYWYVTPHSVQEDNCGIIKFFRSAMLSKLGSNAEKIRLHTCAHIVTWEVLKRCD